MDADLIKLAKSDIRAAMKTELAKNIQIIESHMINRRTPRYIKEIVFYAMARNHAITHFLKLSEPLPRELYFNIPMNEDYWNLMQKVGATRYPLEIKQKAERHLFNDYTHKDYRRRHHFLDIPLPEKPPIHRLFESAIKIASVSIQFWWIFLIAFIAWKYIEDDSNPVSSPSLSSGYNNTFNSEGIPSGNTAFTSTSDSFQVQDSSGQAGFGNEGLSGYDASSSPALHDVESIPAPYSSIPGSDSEGEEEATITDKKLSSEKQDGFYANEFSENSSLPIFEDEEFKVKEGYVTLGSTKEEVISIMGEPDYISNLSYRYGLSQIYFRGDKVSGWSIIDKELKVSLGDKNEEALPFTLGSSKRQVVEAMGTPDSVNDQSFSYHFSNIYFNTDGRVNGWSKIKGQLNVIMSTTIKEVQPFTIGSTVEEVIAVMGTPDSYSNSSLTYKYSRINIREGKVTSYSDISNNLIIVK